jgi:hypothetical protein
MGYSGNTHESFLHAILEGFTEAYGIILKTEGTNFTIGLCMFLFYCVLFEKDVLSNK